MTFESFLEKILKTWNELNSMNSQSIKFPILEFINEKFILCVFLSNYGSIFQLFLSIIYLIKKTLNTTEVQFYT